MQLHDRSKGSGVCRDLPAVRQPGDNACISYARPSHNSFHRSVLRRAIGDAELVPADTDSLPVFLGRPLRHGLVPIAASLAPGLLVQRLAVGPVRSSASIRQVITILPSPPTTSSNGLRKQDNQETPTVRGRPTEDVPQGRTGCPWTISHGLAPMSAVAEPSSKTEAANGPVRHCLLLDSASSAWTDPTRPNPTRPSRRRGTRRCTASIDPRTCIRTTPTRSRWRSRAT